MSALNNRIKEMRLARGLTLAQVADYLGVKEATAQRYESGAIKTIKYETIVNLANLFNCTPQYLMDWDREPEGLDLSILEIYPDYKLGKETISEYLARMQAKNILPLPKTRKVPMLGTIACGEPILATENIDTYVDVPEDVRCDFTLRCKGDSMIGARIYDGDIVYIREQPDVENGEIAAVLIDGSETEATLKRVYKSEGQIMLMPENSAYQPMVYTGADMVRVRILGKAVAFTSAIR